MRPAPLLPLAAGCVFVAVVATTASADCAAELEALLSPPAAAPAEPGGAQRPSELPANSQYADAGMAGGAARDSALGLAEAALARGDEKACLDAVALARTL